MKDTTVAYLLWFFGGGWGLHRFYLGHVGMGLLYMFTGALCGVGWIVDAALIPGLVEQANAEAMGHYHASKHYFRPAPEYRRQSSPLGIVLAIVGVFALGGCGLFMFAAMLGGARQAERAEAMHEAELARQEAERARAREDVPIAPRVKGARSKHPEVRKLQDASARLHSVIEGKLDPMIERFEGDLRKSRLELKRLKPQVKKEKSAAHKAKKLIEECKEIKAFLERLKAERERYQRQVDELEFSVRNIERKLELAEVMGEDDKDQLQKLVALSETLVNEANKGFKHEKGSLADEIEKKSEAGESDLDPELESALEDAIGDE